jgi:site-specific recombinase XerD
MDRLRFAASIDHPTRSFAMTPLRQRMLEDMSIRNLAENTQQSYLQQVSTFARYFGCRPDTMGPEKVREYQVHLVEDCKLAPSSVSIAVSALRFLYKVTLKKPWAPDEIRCPRSRSSCR